MLDTEQTQPNGVTLAVVLLLIFSVLVIPALFFVLGFSYYQAGQTVRVQLNDALERAQRATA